MFVKLSILLFYRRIFTNRIRLFRIALTVIGVYVVMVGIGATIEFIVQCLPIRLFWARAYVVAGLHDPHPVKGTCLPQNLHTAFPLFASLASDVAILLLPVAALWNLKMVLAKKLSIGFALSLGVFACGIEIVRIYYTFQISNSGDITWTNTGSLVWSGVEPSVAIACACIPTMAPLLKHTRRNPSDRHLNSYQLQREPVRAKTYANRYERRSQTDDDSIRGLKEGTVPAQKGSLGTDDQYSCVATYEPTLGPITVPEASIKMDTIKVSKSLEISHTSNNSRS